MSAPDKTKSAKLGIIEQEDGSITIEDLTIPPPPYSDVPSTRLIITELTVRNFKSYAGEQVLGPFNKNFTAVVGPNGSGKSNVIDSLLFVFGYRAKKIRSKKVSHLIHKSDQFPDLTSCSVTVSFATIEDKGENFIVLPDSTFILKRTAFDDDTSYYEMGKKRVPYKDVSRTLREYGIDLDHSRFLILQGEIEAISLMHPKAQNEHETGMLEYIEDIIGSNRFIEPLKHFQEKVKKLNEERKEKLSQLKLVENEKNELEAPKNKAIEYLRLENKFFIAENSLLHAKRMVAEKEFQHASENKQDCLQKMKEIKSQLGDIQASKKSYEQKLGKINSEYETHVKTYEDHKEKFKRLEFEDVRCAENLKNSKSKGESFTNKLNSAKNELAKLVKQLEVYQKETSELEEMKKKLEDEKNKESKIMSEVMGTMAEETNILQEKKDKLETQLVKLKDNVYEIKSEMDLTQSELNLYLSSKKKEDDQLTSLLSNFEKSSQTAKEQETLLKQDEDRMAVLDSELISLNKDLAKSKEDEATLSEQLKSARFRLEEARSAMHASRHQSGMMQAFLKEKARGRFAGVFGRLGDLGAIDEYYDAAISNACGRLDNIVTDNLATAQECVKYLADNNLGYGTFIALDKMQVWLPHVHRKISTPENVPRLFDLIHVENEKLLPAFYFALKDTLVAKDLEQATRIGLQGRERHRVVTLQGQLVELTGQMTGGGGRALKGKMGQSVVACVVTPEEVNKMTASVDLLAKNVSNLKRACLNIEEQIVRKNKELSALQHSVKMRKLNCKSYKESIEMLKSQIAEQKKKVQEVTIDQKKVNLLESQIKEKNKSFILSTKETSVVEESISKIQAEILKISKGKFSKAQKSMDQLEKKVQENSQAVTKSKINIKLSKRNIKKVEEKIANIEEEIQKNKESKQAAVQQRERITQEATEVNKKIEEAEKEMEKCKEKRTSLKKEKEGFGEKEHELMLEEIEKKNALKKYDLIESEKRSIIKNINSKLVKLKLHKVEDDSTEIPTFTEEEIKKISTKNLASEIDVMKAQLEEMKPDFSSIEEFKKKEKVFNEREKELDVITNERNLQNMRHEDLRKRRFAEFLKGFTKISKKLKEIYQMLTLGGDAEMELVDNFDPFTKGIEFSVRPPKKSWKYMRNLSGGEKTLSSLSLVFALHHYRPTPFYVMDEIDAALDVRNVAIVGYYLKERTKNTQFIIVSLRNVMNELSDHLLGIYKINNCTKNVSISNVTKWTEHSNSSSSESANANGSS